MKSCVELTPYDPDRSGRKDRLLVASVMVTPYFRRDQIPHYVEALTNSIRAKLEEFAEEVAVA